MNSYIPKLINNGAFKDAYFVIDDPVISYMTIYDYRTKKTITVNDNNYTFSKQGTYLIKLYNSKDEILEEATMAYDATDPSIYYSTAIQNGIEVPYDDSIINTYDSVNLNITDNFAIYKVKKINNDSTIEILKEYELSDYNEYETNIEFTKSGNYKITIEDKAGNEITTEFIIK